jgi:hypothetical protein
VAEIEELVSHAVGAESARGDSVAVVLLPGAGAVEATATPAATHAAASAEVTGRSQQSRPEHRFLPWGDSVALIAIAVAVLALLMVLGFWLRGARGVSRGAVDEEAVAARVRQWLTEGAGDGRA